jgi:tetratricopeptide (TPR) repeat protein
MRHRAILAAMTRPTPIHDSLSLSPAILSTLVMLAIFIAASLATSSAQTREAGGRKAPAILQGLDLVDVDPYARCLGRIAEAPLAAYNDAQAWRARGGGDAARHCAALAILQGGDATLAAEELESLAAAMRLRPAGLRAQVLAQAARAWTAAGRLAKAHAAISVAIGLTPGDPELRIDRAEIRAESGALWEAIDDLNHVLERAPRRADALVMRAAAHRRLAVIDLAAEDVSRALAIAPELPEAWLERGILDRAAGRFDAARGAWIRVLAADPDGPAGEAARGHIEALEYGSTGRR